MYRFLYLIIASPTEVIKIIHYYNSLSRTGAADDCVRPGQKLRVSGAEGYAEMTQ
jgi:hypothetical protein